MCSPRERDCEICNEKIYDSHYLECGNNEYYLECDHCGCDCFLCEECNNYDTYYYCDQCKPILLGPCIRCEKMNDIDIIRCDTCESCLCRECANETYDCYCGKIKIESFPIIVVPPEPIIEIRKETVSFCSSGQYELMMVGSHHPVIDIRVENAPSEFRLKIGRVAISSNKSENKVFKIINLSPSDFGKEIIYTSTQYLTEKQRKETMTFSWSRRVGKGIGPRLIFDTELEPRPYKIITTIYRVYIDDIPLHDLPPLYY